MGKSAKFTKRQTRKEKLGLSSNAASLKVRQRPMPVASRPQHRPMPAAPALTSTSASHPLIEAEPLAMPEEDGMDEEEGGGADQGKRKKVGLKEKVAKKVGRGAATEEEAGRQGKREKKDYVDLYDLPDRRKGKAKKTRN